MEFLELLVVPAAEVGGVAEEETVGVVVLDRKSVV